MIAELEQLSKELVAEKEQHACTIDVLSQKRRELAAIEQFQKK